MLTFQNSDQIRCVQDGMTGKQSGRMDGKAGEWQGVLLSQTQCAKEGQPPAFRPNLACVRPSLGPWQSHPKTFLHPPSTSHTDGVSSMMVAAIRKFPLYTHNTYSHQVPPKPYRYLASLSLLEVQVDQQLLLLAWD